MQKQTLYLLTFACLIWFGAIMLSSEFGVLNFDEPWYLTASHLVATGQVPYRDFAFTQAPLLPYFYGAALGLVGENIAIGRYVSVGLAVLTLALALNIAHTIAGTRAAILTFVLLVATPDVLYFLAIIKTYSLAAGLTLSALALVLHRGSSPSTALPFVSTLLAGMAAMTRISFLPVLFLVFLYWALHGRWKASALGVVLVVFVVLVFATNSNNNFLFDIFEFHLRLSPTPDTGIADSPKVALALVTAIAFAPSLSSAIFLVALWSRFPALRIRLAGWWRIQMDMKLLLLLVATGLWTIHFVAPGNFWEYQTPGYFLLVILLASVASLLTYVKDRPIFTILLAACAVASSVPAWTIWSPMLWQPTNTLLSASKESEALARVSHKGNTLLGSFNHLALAGGLQIYPDNEMGMFSVSAELPHPESTWRHFLSEEAVTTALLRCSATFVATGTGTPFQVSVPSTIHISPGTLNQWADLLRENYRLIYNDSQVSIFERTVENCETARDPNSYEPMVSEPNQFKPNTQSLQ